MPSIVFRCIGDRAHGFGHVMRDLVLAAALRERGCDVRFITDADTPGLERIQAAGYPWRTPGTWYSDGAIAYNEDAFVFDLEHGPTRAELEEARAQYPYIVNIGGIGFAQSDPAAVARLVDLQVYGGELFDPPQSGNVLHGPEHLILDPAYARCEPNYTSGHIVVALGGADPHHLTQAVFEHLPSRNAKIVFGPAADPTGVRWMSDGKSKRINFFAGDVPIKSDRDPDWYYDFIVAPPNLLDILDGAALCVTATGMTAYESLCAGVPVLLTNWSADHLRTAHALEVRGCGYNFGLWDRFDGQTLHRRLEFLLRNPDMLALMGNRGRALVDGKGAARVADYLVAHVPERVSE